MGDGWGGRAEGLKCAPLISAHCLPLAFTESLSLARLNSLLPKSAEHQELSTLVSGVTPTGSRGGPAMRKRAKEGIRRKERERKGIYYSARPRPLHAHAIKNRKSIAETNGF